MKKPTCQVVRNRPNKIMKLTTRNGVKTSGKKIMADGTAIPPEVKRLMEFAYATTAFDSLGNKPSAFYRTASGLVMRQGNVAIGGKKARKDHVIIMVIMAAAIP